MHLQSTNGTNLHEFEVSYMWQLTIMLRFISVAKSDLNYRILNFRVRARK